MKIVVANQKLPSLFDLKGKTAVVTGASRGIGQMAATTLAEAGADIVLCDLAGLDDSVKRIESLGRRSLPLKVDVSSRESIQKAIANGVQKFEKLDIIFNAAGTNLRKPAEEFTEQDWNIVVNVNLRGTFYCCQEVGKQFIAQKSGGKIINVASLLSAHGVPITGIVPYACSKAGVGGLTRSLALEWAKHKINVNAVGPGYISTELTRSIHEDPARSSMIESRIPMGRWGVPEDLKGAVLFLASPASDYVTGQILFVDGGFTTN